MAVIDASVAVRWFVYGPGNDQAAPWLLRTDLIGPDLITAEVGNAFWQYVRRGHLKLEEATAILMRLPECFSYLIAVQELIGDALLLAHQYDHPIYDCFYLALGRRERAAIVTLDRKQASIADRMGLEAELLL